MRERARWLLLLLACTGVFSACRSSESPRQPEVATSGTLRGSGSSKAVPKRHSRLETDALCDTGVVEACLCRGEMVWDETVGACVLDWGDDPPSLVGAGPIAGGGAAPPQTPAGAGSVCACAACSDSFRSWADHCPSGNTYREQCEHCIDQAGDAASSARSSVAVRRKSRRVRFLVIPTFRSRVATRAATCLPVLSATAAPISTRTA